MFPMPQRTAKRNIEAKQKARQALELRRAGMSYDAIAEHLGMAKSSVWTAVGKAIDEVTKEPAKRVRAQEIDRLDRLMLGLWDKAKKGDVQAVDRVIKLMERRAKLLGLDAPTKTQETSDVTFSGFQLSEFDAVRAAVEGNTCLLPTPKKSGDS